MVTPRLRRCTTAELGADELARLRALLDDAFLGNFADTDWGHTVGGTHVVLQDGPDLVAHGSVVERLLRHGGQSLRTGYVEGVAVRADARRRGYASLVMAELESLREEFELLALSASEAGAALYVARGWQPWRGPTSVLGPDGVVPTPDDDGSIYVLSDRARLDLDGELTCDWRDGDVW
jgi:aminoglycoside 2'-N-acetyltransferase I